MNVDNVNNLFNRLGSKKLYNGLYKIVHMWIDALLKRG